MSQCSRVEVSTDLKCVNSHSQLGRGEVEIGRASRLHPHIPSAPLTTRPLPPNRQRPSRQPNLNWISETSKISTTSRDSLSVAAQRTHKKRPHGPKRGKVERSSTRCERRQPWHAGNHQNARKKGNRESSGFALAAPLTDTSSMYGARTGKRFGQRGSRRIQTLKERSKGEYTCESYCF